MKLFVTGLFFGKHPANDTWQLFGAMLNQHSRAAGDRYCRAASVIHPKKLDVIKRD
jgi:hypothetical protein